VNAVTAYVKSERFSGVREKLDSVYGSDAKDSAIDPFLADAQARSLPRGTMTSNMRLGDAPGNVRVTRLASSLPQESVVNVPQLITLDKQRLAEKVGRLPAEALHDVEAGIRLVLSL
jgi:mRNA interferase MazF